MINSTTSLPKTISSLADILRLRSEWELLVANYKIRDYNGTIDNLEWYVKYGVRSNRFRDGFDLSMEIARQILSEVNRYEKAHLSSVHGKKIQAI